MFVYESVKGRPEPGYKEQLKQYFDSHNIEQPLVIHFHGGVNSHHDAMRLGWELAPKYVEAGGHPLFFSWSSDISTALTPRILARLNSHWKKKRFKQLSAAVDAALKKPKTRATLKYALVARKNGATIPAKKLKCDRDEINDVVNDHELDAVIRFLKSLFGFLFRKSELVREMSGVVEKILWRCYKEDRPKKLIVAEELIRATVNDDIAQDIWDTMKSTIHSAFRPSGAGTYFLKELEKYVNSKPQANIRIILIGHSAGTIYISHLIRAAANICSTRIKFEIVFQAAAVSFKDFHELVISNKRKVKSVRIFGLGDQREQADHLGALYPGSLLYFVSGLLEEKKDMPLMGMEMYFKPHRYYKGVVKKVREYLQPWQDTRVWSPDLKDSGWRCNASGHGGFSCDFQTISSMQHIIKVGFGTRPT